MRAHDFDEKGVQELATMANIGAGRPWLKIWWLAGLVAGLGAAFPTVAVAQDWTVVGARQQAMGGTGTALTEGATSAFWNPAHFALDAAGDPEWIGQGRLPGIDVNFETFVAGNSRGNFAALGDAGFKTVRFIRDSARFNDLAVWLASPTSDMKVDLKQEVTGVAALIVQLSTLQEPQHALIADTGLALDVQVDEFGFHFGSKSLSGAFPLISFAGLGITGETPEALAEGFAREFGTGGEFEFAPAAGSLNLSAGAIRLASELRFARFQLNGSTAAGGYNRADLLAWWFDVAAAESGLDLDSQIVRDGIVRIVTNIGGDNPFSTGQSPFGNNESAIRLRRLQLFEFSVGSATKLIDQPEWKVLIGANIRGILGRTRVTDFFLRDPDAVKDELIDAVIGVFELSGGAGRHEQFQVTLDLGLTVMLFEERLRVSFVGRNLPPPHFFFADSGEVRLPTEARMGLAVSVLPGYLSAAMDVDLVKQTSVTLVRFDSRWFGFGVEYTPFGPCVDEFRFSVRAGVRSNLLAGREIMLTGGFGFRIGVFEFDLGGAVMLHTVETTVAPTNFAWLAGDSPLGIGAIPQAGTLGIGLSVAVAW